LLRWLLTSAVTNSSAIPFHCLIKHFLTANTSQIILSGNKSFSKAIYDIYWQTASFLRSYQNTDLMLLMILM